MAENNANPSMFCRSPEDFEKAAELWLRHWGYADALRTPKGVDAGIDVQGQNVVAQVKAWMTPVGRPEIQQLRGVVHDGRVPVFFSLMAYTDEAMEFAAKSGVALYRFVGYDGAVEPLNESAKRIFSCIDLRPSPKKDSVVLKFVTEHVRDYLSGANEFLTFKTRNVRTGAGEVSFHKKLDSGDCNCIGASCNRLPYSAFTPDQTEYLISLGWHGDGEHDLFKDFEEKHGREILVEELASITTLVIENVFCTHDLDIEVVT